MKWLWRQDTGELLQQIDDNLFSDVIATGYSGMGEGKNDPTKQCIGDVGPIPRGDYKIGDATDEPSSYTLRGPPRRLGVALKPHCRQRQLLHPPTQCSNPPRQTLYCNCSWLLQRFPKTPSLPLGYGRNGV
jgi:hypothetical protein